MPADEFTTADQPADGTEVEAPAAEVAGADQIAWLSTKAAARRLGITPRTLYRFIDEGQLAAYRFGRVIRLKQSDVDAYIDQCRIRPGTLEHLYPETVETQA